MLSFSLPGKVIYELLVENESYGLIIKSSEIIANPDSMNKIKLKWSGVFISFLYTKRMSV